ncbi:MAG: AbrB/MazE/SpoVT family DNA-binding domain-containing protein [Micrococcales bacterium]|nr:AbrB/MazE/SpoVT family DNA-binding domain-containing protein [Micrococcales bacterium]
MPTVDLRDRNQITLPLDVRRALHVEIGDRLDFQVASDGTVSVRGLKSIPADQAWFWTPEWQAKEREADEALTSGRTITFHSVEEMDAYLDTVAKKTEAF